MPLVSPSRREIVRNSMNAKTDSLAEQLLELAAKSGAEAAEVFQSQSFSRPLFFEANRLKQIEVTETEGTALRVWRHGQPGLAVAYGPVAPQLLVERAIALSDLNEPETIDLTPGNVTQYPDLGEAVAVEQLMRWGETAIALVRESYPEAICNAEWECESETTRLLNSKGLDCSYTDITLSGYLTADWVRGDDFLNVSDGQIQRGSLDPVTLAHQIVQRLDWARQSAIAPSKRMPVLFTAKAADMLWGTVQAALSGKQVVERASPWSDRLGTPVVADSITLMQSPTEGPFSCPFDDEGVPTRPITFIRDGVLQLFYTDHRMGRALGSGTTGNGFRPGLGSYPTPGVFNLLVKPGTAIADRPGKSLPELIATMADGIIVDQILGGGAGISGEFSINVDLGYRVRHGEILGRIKDTMVSGNVYTALKQVIELGGDAEWNGACYTPSLIVGGLSVTGRQADAG